MEMNAGTQGADAPSAMSARAGWIALAVTLVAVAASMLADKAVFDAVHDPRVYERDWGRLLRVTGFMGTWVALALAVGLHDAGARPALVRPRRRAWLLLLAPGVAGLAAEILKIVIRRERPALHDGLYGFRPWSERTFSGGGLAFPSSHTAVAFGGAAMLGFLFPRARWVGYVLAAGCGGTRIMARAHFLSDVVLAAGIGWLVAWGMARRLEDRR
jgi:membrane-associated phospholipid phosphatase